MLAALPLIVSGIQAAIQSAPQIEAIYADAKNWVSSLFSNGVITAAQQQQVNDHIDALAAAFANGTTPPEFTVEADPAS